MLSLSETQRLTQHSSAFHSSPTSYIDGLLDDFRLMELATNVSGVVRGIRQLSTHLYYRVFEKCLLRHPSMSSGFVSLADSVCKNWELDLWTLVTPRMMYIEYGVVASGISHRGSRGVWISIGLIVHSFVLSVAVSLILYDTSLADPLSSSSGGA